MNELIKITVNAKGQKIVSSREVYEKLGLNPAHYARWTRKNIVNNQFAIINEDWAPLTIEVNGNKTTEYALLIPFAKKLAMMARTPEGEVVRDYFLNCEDAAKNPSVKIPTPTEIAYLLIQSEHDKEIALEQNRLLSETIKQQAPKVEYADKVLTSGSKLRTTNIAAELGMSAKALNKILKDKGVQWSVNGVWTLTSRYQGHGYTKTETYPYLNQNGEDCTAMSTVWTEKGREFIHKLLNANLNQSMSQA